MVEVIYRGGNMDGITSNAASEATLLKLLAKLGGASSGGGKDAQNLYNEAQKKGTSEINKNARAQKKHKEAVGQDTSATEEHTDSVKESSKWLDYFAEKGKGLVQGVGNAIGGITSAMLEGKTGLGDYTAHMAGLAKAIPGIGLMAGPAQGVVTALDAQIDIIRQVNSVGGNLGQGLLAVQTQAREATTSVEAFAGVITEHATTLSQAFGGSSKGMLEFAQILKGVKAAGMDQKFAMLGYKVEEQAEFTAEYIDLQRIQGRLDGKQRSDLIKGSQNYLYELDRLAKVTGMSRKEAAASLREQSKDSRLAMMYATMDENEKKRVEEYLSMLKSISPKMYNAAVDIITTGGNPFTKEGQRIQAFGPVLSQGLLDLKNGAIQTEEMIAITKGVAKDVNADIKLNGETFAAAVGKGVPGMDILSEWLKFSGDSFGKLKTATDNQEKQTKDATKELMNLEQQVINVRNEVIAGLAPIFKELSEQAGKLVTWLGSEEGTKKMQDLSTTVSTWLTKIIEDLKTMNPNELFTEYLEKPLKAAGINIPTWVKDMFLGPARTSEIKALETEQATLEAALKKSVDGMTTITVNGKEMLVSVDSVKERLDAIKKQLAEAEAGQKGWMAKFIEDTSWLEKSAIAAGAGGAIVLGLLAVKAAFAGLAGVLNLFGVGLAAKGAVVLAGLFLALGGSIWLTGKGIEMAGTGVQTIADGLAAMSNIKDTDTLKSVAGVLGDMAGPLTQMATGGVIASFISEGAFERLAEGINSFATVDASKLHAVGPAIAALYEGTSKFTGKGAWEGFSKWLGGLFSKDKGLGELADELKAFDGIDSTKLASLGQSLEGIGTFINSIQASGNLNKQVAAVNSLVEGLSKYQDKYNELSAEMKNSLNMSINSSGKDTVEALNQLNTVLKQLVTEQQTSNTIGKKLIGSVENAGTIG